MKINRNIRYAVMVTALCLVACGEAGNIMKHAHSSFTGLNRKITLYSANGQPIKEWVTSAKIEDHGGSVFFICNSKAVTVAGTFIIEEQ